MKDEVVNEKRIKVWITILSIGIPLVVAFLFRYKLPNVEPLSFLPPIYATINGLTAICLILGVLAIRKGKQKLHQNFMSFCILLSVLFLGMYVAYHMTSESTSYGGEGIIKYVYFFILITHIVLSIVIIPLVLITYSKSYFLKDYVAHKKWARFTFPIWLYVAITGVVVYLMISPYY
jgi:putative membrane protein